ncbi:MAG: hypothetical protein H0V16_02485 [Burkholderiaceae bacterium]|nr:hypothetical protein [Burkholderiaceae bacterium]
MSEALAKDGSAAAYARNQNWIDRSEVAGYLETKAAVGALGHVGIDGGDGFGRVGADFLSSAAEFSLLQQLLDLGARPAQPDTRSYAIAQPVGARVAEGVASPVQTRAVTASTLPALKHIGGPLVATKETLRAAEQSGASLERWLSAQLAVGAYRAEDRSMLDSSFALSLTFGLTPIASTGTTVNALDVDLNGLFGTFTGDLRTAVLVVSPAVALHLGLLRSSGPAAFPGIGINGGQLAGVRVLVSSGADNGATSMAVLISPSLLQIWRGPVNLEASRQGSLQMDTAPTQTSLTPTASTTVSMFQTNSVALQASIWGGWTAGAGAVALISNIAL